MLIDQTKIIEHYTTQANRLAKAIALTTPDTLTTCPVQFAMVHGLPVWAVKEARRRVKND